MSTNRDHRQQKQQSQQQAPTTTTTTPRAYDPSRLTVDLPSTAATASSSITPTFTPTIGGSVDRLRSLKSPTTTTAPSSFGSGVSSSSSTTTSSLSSSSSSSSSFSPAFAPKVVERRKATDQNDSSQQQHASSSQYQRRGDFKPKFDRARSSQNRPAFVPRERGPMQPDFSRGGIAPPGNSSTSDMLLQSSESFGADNSSAAHTYDDSDEEMMMNNNGDDKSKLQLQLAEEEERRRKQEKLLRKKNIFEGVRQPPTILPFNKKTLEQLERLKEEQQQELLTSSSSSSSSSTTTVAAAAVTTSVGIDQDMETRIENEATRLLFREARDTNRSDELLFLQLPSSLPINLEKLRRERERRELEELRRRQAAELQQQGAAGNVGDSIAKNRQLAAQREQERLLKEKLEKEQQGAKSASVDDEENIWTIPFDNTLTSIPNGYIGEMVVYQSGKTKLKLGNVWFDVVPGSDFAFMEHVAAVAPNKGATYILGDVAKRVMCTPDVERLLYEAKKNPLPVLPPHLPGGPGGAGGAMRGRGIPRGGGPMPHGGPGRGGAMPPGAPGRGGMMMPPGRGGMMPPGRGMMPPGRGAPMARGMPPAARGGPV